MSISVYKTFSAGETLTAADLNASFTNFTTNATSLVSPFTANVSMGGNTLYYDAANTIGLTSGTSALNLAGAALNTPQASNVASASTIDLDAAAGNVVDVTGTTTITAITLSQGRWRVVRFTGALTLTNGASLVLPGGANITTVAGDYALFVGYAAGVVRCALYSPITVTGTGAAVNANTPTFTTPILGVANATSINKVAITAPASSATLTIADGKTLAVSNTLTLIGTDSKSVTFPSSDTVFGFGTYTPILTSITNIASSTGFPCRYFRFGDSGYVFGYLELNPTAGSSITTIAISLPVASNFSTTKQASGVAATGASGATADVSGSIFSNIANDRADLYFISGASTSTYGFNFSFGYTII